MKQGERVQRVVRKLTDYSVAELIAVIDGLRADGERRDEEHEALAEQLAVLRSCRDPHCHLCSPCVVALFVKAHPLPLALPQKYVDTGAWRK